MITVNVADVGFVRLDLVLMQAYGAPCAIECQEQARPLEVFRKERQRCLNVGSDPIFRDYLWANLALLRFL